MKRSQLQHGQGSVEFLLAAPIVLLLSLSSIEAVHWFFMRQAVGHALMQAGRAAITQHARPDILDTAFAQALVPFYAAPTAAESRARMESAILRRERATGMPAWRIEILSPSTASFRDFSTNHPDLPAHGHAIIDNDYLSLQHRSRVAMGWQEGRGPESGQTVVEANTLVLHLTWLHEPLLPGVRQLLKSLAPTDSQYGSRAMALAGYLPIQREISLLMQSHPIAWNLPAHGRVLRQGQAAPSAASPSGPPLLSIPSTPSPCSGLWCLNSILAGNAAKPAAPAPAGGSTPRDDPTFPRGNDSGLTDFLPPRPGAEKPPSQSGAPATDPYTSGSGAQEQQGESWPTPDDGLDDEFAWGNNELPDLADDCPGCCD